MLHQAYYIGHPVPVKRVNFDPLVSGAIPKTLRDVPGGVSRPVRIGDDWWANPEFWQGLTTAGAQAAQAASVIATGQPVIVAPPATSPYGPVAIGPVPAPTGYPPLSYFQQPSAIPSWVWIVGAGGLGLVLLLMLMPSGGRRR